MCTFTWTLLKILPANQSRFLIQAKRHHPSIELYVPYYEKLIRPHKGRRSIRLTLPLYPGYIFARPNFAQGEHFLLVRLPTRARFIRFDGEIEIIPDHIIESLKTFESMKLLLPIEKPRALTPGNRVIVHFPTTDIIATLIRTIANARAIVDTPLGRVTVPLPAIQECNSPG